MNKRHDQCDLCGDQVAVRRITNWKINRLCARCAKAYKLGVDDMREWQKGRARMDKGRDPF